MDIKQEDESGLKYDLVASRPTSKLQIILYHEKQNKKILIAVLFIFTPPGINLYLIQ